MVSPLIKTKVSIPRLRDGLVARPDLIERLKTGLYCPLTLVSAPAGYGKTTLLAELASHVPAAWLSLDRGDNDPVRFWTHFASAIRTQRPYPEDTVFRTSMSFEAIPVRHLLIQLINDISGDDKAEHPYIIILDDYHLIYAKDIHTDMVFLLEHLPEQLRIVISTRADPPLPLARMRARGQLSEFRAHDLRFTTAEIAAVYNRIMGLGLSPDDIAALEARTEGWIASLQMAAISMKKSRDIPAFIAAFTGTHRHVIDYLTGEVLDQQTDNIRSFLIETSFLNHLSGPLCDAVTGRNDSLEILLQLEAANLFVVPLDDERKWYRYHHLFASLLASRLQQTGPGKINELHKRAADWFSRNGFVDEAIPYALAAGDYETAARLIEDNGGENVLRSETDTLLNRLALLPEDAFLKHPGLSLYYAMIFSNTGKIDAAELWLKKIEGIPLPPPWQAPANIARAFIAIARQDDRRAIELFTSVIGDKQDMITSNDEFQSDRAMMFRIYAGHLLSYVQKAQGHLRAAIETSRSILNTYGDKPVKAPWDVAMTLPHNSLADFLYEQNDLEKAMYHTERGMAIADQVRHPSLQAIAWTLTGLIYQAQEKKSGDSEYKAPEVVMGEDGRLQSEKIINYPTVTLHLMVRMRFAQGNSAAIIQCIKSFEQIADLDRWRSMSSTWPTETIDTAIAYAFLANGEFKEAAALLENLQQRAERAGRNGNLIEILLMQALAAQALGNNARALELVERAMVMAEPEGYFRIFIDMGAPMAELLREAARRNMSAHYARRLLAEFAGVKPKSPSPLIEPLTGRELEVLQMLAGGLSNQEIAEKLVVSTGTVKTHTHNIYAKLGVRTRTQAIKRAMNLNLV